MVLFPMFVRWLSWKYREKERSNRETEEDGVCVFIRHGGRPDWYQNPMTKVTQPIPRHGEIKDGLAKHIIKLLKDTVKD